jgi:hypothetical protein
MLADFSSHVQVLKGKRQVKDKKGKERKKKKKTAKCVS